MLSTIGASVYFHTRNHYNNAAVIAEKSLKRITSFDKEISEVSNSHLTNNESSYSNEQDINGTYFIDNDRNNVYADYSPKRSTFGFSQSYGNFHAFA